MKRKVTNKSRAWEKTFVGNPHARELVDLTVFIRHETDNAYLVSEGLKDENGKEIRHWLPKSMTEVQGPHPADDAIDITIPRWLYEEKGFK